MSSQPPAPQPSPQAIKVLLLEDSAFDAELLAEELRAAYPRASLDVVQDGEGFAQALRRGSYDVILSDHELGGYSGDEALALAREHAAFVPFIFVSGVIGEDNAVDLLKRGATDYVSKGRLSRLPLVLERAMREVAERAARSNAELRLVAAKEEAERANLAKDRFLAVLSHELRTPLSSMSFAAHLLEKVATVPPKFGELLPTIRRNVALEARLIDDLLDISAITTGKLGIKPEVLDMRDVLGQVARTSQEQSDQKNVRLVYIPATEPAWVVGDDARLQQVVSNLVRNAIKFSPAGTEVRLEGHVDNALGQFVCTCTDQGVGMKPEALERIFGAFEQADGEVSRRFGGLGLGLAIARFLVAQHDGSLQAHSDGPGRGATFTLRLPLVQAGADVSADRPAAPAEVENAGKRVLLVEDNRAAAETLGLCLEDYGWAPVHVETCAAALAAASAQPFDIVLTDLGLPDGSGVEIGRALSRRLPVVALTGYGAAGDKSATTAAGFVAHLVKPADPAVIHDVLGQALQSWRRGAG
ncbi:response regulator [Xylophilus sp. GOD-11R]|uniref:ATP-binding response regulator n=1 Tax=Xylophilus sp. GOD-11R TaxID=3089814 RepID=UPI00298CFD80|nr:response regulator [Xylophilus sp. GOD-11R]WPB56087.1 response regulator [Xylophilus sp. GOD-11R]